MKTYKKGKYIRFSWVPLIFTLFISGPAAAVQPFQIIGKNPDAFFIRQGPAKCAQTSFYIVFNYYGDNAVPSPFFYNEKGEAVDLYETIPMMSAASGKDDKISPKITKLSKISKWINPASGGTSWRQLKAGAERLTYKDKGLKKYYTHIVSRDDPVDHGESGQDMKRNILQNSIRPILLNNHPVIVHLRRKYPIPGHYLVIVGYDEKKGQVYYINPNKPKSADVIQTISEETFIRDKWYTGHVPRFWGPAEWDGKWLAFYR